MVGMACMLYNFSYVYKHLSETGSLGGNWGSAHHCSPVCYRVAISTVSQSLTILNRLHHHHTSESLSSTVSSLSPLTSLNPASYLRKSHYTLRCRNAEHFVWLIYLAFLVSLKNLRFILYMNYHYEKGSRNELQHTSNTARH